MEGDFNNKNNLEISSKLESNFEDKVPVKCGDKIFYFDSETAKEIEEAFAYYKEFLKG
jgi:hypothetical protein